MSATDPRPWQEFRVGKPSKSKSGFEPDCKPLLTVSHVAHVPAAIRILEDRRIRSDLVYDESELNQERIRVVWLSPNDWSQGFRYGNIRFTFDWASLVEGKQAYWVECMRQYNPNACRILITASDYSKSLQVYDPADGDGPWWCDSDGNHFWNGKYCLEIMHEENVRLSKRTEIDFVTHHPKYCSISALNCSYLGTPTSSAGAEFIASMVARGSSLKYSGLTESNGGKLEPSPHLRSAVDKLLIRAAKACPSPNGTVESTDSEAGSLARALLSTLVNSGLMADSRSLGSIFKSEGDLRTAIADAVAKSAGLPNGEIFLEDGVDPFEL